MRRSADWRRSATFTGAAGWKRATLNATDTKLRFRNAGLAEHSPRPRWPAHQIGCSKITADVKLEVDCRVKPVVVLRGHIRIKSSQGVQRSHGSVQDQNEMAPKVMEEIPVCVSGGTGVRQQTNKLGLSHPHTTKEQSCFIAAKSSSPAAMASTSLLNPHVTTDPSVSTR